MRESGYYWVKKYVFRRLGDPDTGSGWIVAEYDSEKHCWFVTSEIRRYVDEQFAQINETRLLPTTKH